ncbi:MAG: beta-ketoacyl-[acyl-carrier-protein] synthase family protein [Lentisphaerae bacterium]|jgi:3-oxoacyl-[acyl-carrier-protein] synthase II|nr:beta-ketoacyl-[acyl-carrier-protein] synthase family protein [Lentisphaerota bacterium]
MKMSKLRERIVITGVGLTAPNGNNLEEFRHNLLNGVSGITTMEHRYIGKVNVGLCNFDPKIYQNRRDIRNGTRAGSISIYCANEAIKDAGIELNDSTRSRVGVFAGTTEHGNVETENEVFNISQFDYDVAYWSHHHNPRSVANNPAGEVTLNMNITGPHLCVGAACAAGNCGIIYGAQQLMLGEVDVAIAGGVSESPHTFGIFASFRSQGALAYHEDPTKASRPYDLKRNGIVISEGGCLYVLERLEDARRRGAKIYAEIAGYCMNSDAFDTVLPLAARQAECFRIGIDRSGITPYEVDLVNSHATGTVAGDIQETIALRSVYTSGDKTPFINNTKGYIGHAMGAAGALELAGNLPSFNDLTVHPCLNVDELDPECQIPNLVYREPVKADKIDFIANNSFGMLGNNSVLIIKRFDP